MKYETYDASKFVAIERPQYDASVKDRSVAECIDKMREEGRKRERELRPLWIKTTVKFVVTSFMTYAILGVYAMVLFLAHFVLYENRAEMIETGEFVLVQTINPVTVICIVIAALATIALIYASVLENANEARRYLASKGLKWF